MATVNRNFKVKNGLEVTGTVSASGLAGTLLSDTSPGMDGSASAGTSTVPARADHVHPADTSKAPLSSPTFTGTPAAPTAAADTDTTQIATTAFVIGQAASTAPADNGTAAVGTSKKFARADHVHKASASVVMSTSEPSSPTDGMVWVDSDSDVPSLDPSAYVDAAGDLLVGSAADTLARLPLGTNGYVLTVDTAGSGADKVKWAAPAEPLSPFLLMGA